MPQSQVFLQIGQGVRMLVEKVIGKVQDFELEKLKVDRVLLDHDDINKPHQKFRTEAGETVAVSLPHGDRLFCGAVLYKDDDSIIVVDMPEEDVLEIYPQGNIQWARTAFNIGNMHQPAYLYEDRIMIPYDAVMENLINSLGVDYERCERKLDGERANCTSAGHSHSYSHEHVHFHSDGHNHE